jgi:hypothetical protein
MQVVVVTKMTACKSHTGQTILKYISLELKCDSECTLMLHEQKIITVVLLSRIHCLIFLNMCTTCSVKYFNLQASTELTTGCRVHSLLYQIVFNLDIVNTEFTLTSMM